MSYLVAWSKAKSTFESSTKQKKPSDTFLGVFRKGSGIEGALKLADAAKAAGDLKKALEKFDAAAATYTDQLDKAIANPKVTDPGAKTVYANAAKVLKNALADIRTEANGSLALLENSSKKDKVDPEALRIQAAANAHLALRKKMVGEAKKWLQDAKNKDVEGACANAKKQFANAKAAMRKDRSAFLIAAPLVPRFADQAATLLAEIETAFNAERKSGSDLMSARGDFPSVNKLPADQQEPFKRAAGKLFKEIDDAQIALQGYINDLKGKVAEAKALAEESEDWGKSTEALVEDFKGRLEKIKAELEKLEGTATTRLMKVKDTRLTQEKKNAVFDAPVKPGIDRAKELLAFKKMVGQLAEQWQTILGKAREELNRANVFGTSIAKMPAEVASDDSIAPLRSACESLLNKLTGAYGDLDTAVKELQSDVVGYLKRS